MTIMRLRHLLAVTFLGASAFVTPARAGGYVSGPNGGFIAKGPGGRYVAQGPNGNYAVGRVAPVYIGPRYVAPVVTTPSVVVASQPVVVAAPPVVVYSPTKATIIAVQTRLSALGFYGGPIDGIIGPATRAAIREFQIANRLAVTGEINPAVISVLR